MGITRNLCSYDSPNLMSIVTEGHNYFIGEKAFEEKPTLIIGSAFGATMEQDGTIIDYNPAAEQVGRALLDIRKLLTKKHDKRVPVIAQQAMNLRAQIIDPSYSDFWTTDTGKYEDVSKDVPMGTFEAAKSAYEIARREEIDLGNIILVAHTAHMDRAKGVVQRVFGREVTPAFNRKVVWNSGGEEDWGAEEEKWSKREWKVRLRHIITGKINPFYFIGKTG